MRSKIFSGLKPKLSSEPDFYSGGQCQYAVGASVEDTVRIDTLRFKGGMSVQVNIRMHSRVARSNPV